MTIVSFKLENSMVNFPNNPNMNTTTFVNRTSEQVVSYVWKDEASGTTCESKSISSKYASPLFDVLSSDENTPTGYTLTSNSDSSDDLEYTWTYSDSFRINSKIVNDKMVLSSVYMKFPGTTLFMNNFEWTFSDEIPSDVFVIDESCSSSL